MAAEGGVAEASRRTDAQLDRKALAAELAAARARLKQKLTALDLSALGLSAYNQRYLGHKIAVVEGELRQISDLLTLCFADSPLPLSQLTFLDHGGGSGIMSVLAKELGVGTVVYNDIYDVSCRDANLLAEAVGLRLDHNVCGDVDAVDRMLRDEQLELNAVASYDVLEHIYDVPEFLRLLGAAPLSSRFFRLVLASSANLRNTRYVRRVTKAHIRLEHEGTQPQWGHKERDALEPYVEIRRRIVREAAPELEPGQVDELARATRGLRRDDIEAAVAEFRERGAISYRADHPTNTCDPNTGNWAEHLMAPAWLERKAQEAGFANARVRAGRYALDVADTGAKGVAKRLLNAMIDTFDARALPVAPYYVLYAERRTA